MYDIQICLKLWNHLDTNKLGTNLDIIHIKRTPSLGLGSAVITHLPPTSEIGVQILAQPQAKNLVDAVHWYRTLYVVV